jgi:hypothetical protein
LKSDAGRWDEREEGSVVMKGGDRFVDRFKAGIRLLVAVGVVVFNVEFSREST